MGARGLGEAALGGGSDKLRDMEAERSLTQLLRAAVGTPLLRTTAPADIYTTLWRHGGGDSDHHCAEGYKCHQQDCGAYCDATQIPGCVASQYAPQSCWWHL